ncbi:hypothetical protein BOSEA31B_14937 [Hyphomicrobiales bacterium]|jgi:hypothetical protein|nr:hypothetical protein BOSEA31B_14937 [Hyphomicrobiales bacterium]CAH1701424.1 hypothetical protein BOSEA1005_21123 [Hyphomicrobiales bacterium]CAI0345381.1 hypothetical protein BO1005MUT1_390053 [Hyphomicrobiales bacterium]
MAVAARIPIVVAVNRQYLRQWRAFAGENFAALPLDAGEIADWCRRAVAGLEA